jgi:hypothetical protein
MDPSPRPSLSRLAATVPALIEGVKMLRGRFFFTSEPVIQREASASLNGGVSDERTPHEDPLNLSPLVAVRDRSIRGVHRGQHVEDRPRIVNVSLEQDAPWSPSWSRSVQRPSGGPG